MDCMEATAKTSIYSPRDPHSRPLYQCVWKHYGGEMAHTDNRIMRIRWSRKVQRLLKAIPIP